MEIQEGAQRPHALLIPYPAHGHIGPFIHLAHILVSHNIAVSFLNTDNNHRKILQNLSPSAPAPTLIRFLSFSDGIHADNERVMYFQEMLDTMNTILPPVIDNIISSLAVSVIISDLWFSCTQSVADKYEIPRIAFRITGGIVFSMWHHAPPITDGIGDDFLKRWRDKVASRVSVTEAVRVKDLPRYFYGCQDHIDYSLIERHRSEIQNAQEHAALVLLNTWDELEEPVLAHLDKEFCGKVLSIGPVDVIAGNCSNTNEEASVSLRKEDKEECLQWLDKQREMSVVYVSMGSLALLSESDAIELGEGLAKSGCPFLWVVRDDMLNISSYIGDLLKRCGERGCVVKWAPQKAVLKHKSVGGFLSHCGGNSMLEALCYAVPMICLPFFADQHCHRFFICHVWKTGLELKDKVSREDVEDVVKKLMDLGSAEGLEMRKNAERFSESAVDAVSHRGSSWCNIKSLVEFLTNSS